MLPFVFNSLEANKALSFGLRCILNCISAEFEMKTPSVKVKIDLPTHS